MSATLLIVEDHKAVRLGLRHWLEVAFPQCRVIEAASAEDAITLCQTESPCVVIMDISLPGMNGIEATRQIKADLPSAQIVMLTLHDDDVYRAEATLAGASAYIPKRVAPTRLIPTLAPLLAIPPTKRSISRPR